MSEVDVWAQGSKMVQLWLEIQIRRDADVIARLISDEPEDVQAAVRAHLAQAYGVVVP